MVDRCVICGEPVPEGRQVCPACIERTVGREQDDMDIHTATEEAYKKGYEDGKRDAVVHGKWVERYDFDNDFYYDCSACGESFCLIEGTPEENFYSYCPNCGARMDGE